MALSLLLAMALWMAPGAAPGAQLEPSAPRPTTERPNMSVPGLEQTLTGVVLDASCSAIADGRSNLTATPKILPPRNAVQPQVEKSEPTTRERAQPTSTSESSVPEQYRDCKVKSSTTSFALYANGKLYMLDRVSNQTMQEYNMKHASEVPDAGSSAWLMRTVAGTATSDNVLTLRTVKK